MSLFDRPVDDRRLGDGQQLVRSDWRFEPALPIREARWGFVARLVAVLAWAGFYALFFLPVVLDLSLGWWRFVSMGISLLIALPAASWIEARRALRTIHILAGQGLVAVGGKQWRVAEIVGVALELDESTTRHAGVDDGVTCRVALVLWEHIGEEFTRIGRTVAGSTDAPSLLVPPSVVAVAAERALDQTTILTTTRPIEARTAAAGLASNLGVSVVEV